MSRPWGRLTDMSNNQSQFVLFSVTFRGVEMSPPVCKTLGCILKILFHELWIFHILLKIQRLVDPDKCHHSCKHDGFLLSWGVWRHGIFVSRWNVKERDTHVIQPIRWRLRNSWSVSTFVCHMHQTFSLRSVGVTSEAETRATMTVNKQD